MPSTDEAKIADWFSGGWLGGWTAGDTKKPKDEATYLSQGQGVSGEKRHEQSSIGAADTIGSIQAAPPSQQQNTDIQMKQMLGSLTEKDQEGPTSFSVTPDKSGGYTYKMDGRIGKDQQQQLGSASPQASAMGTEDDFMKAYGG